MAEWAACRPDGQDKGSPHSSKEHLYKLPRMASTRRDAILRLLREATRPLSVGEMAAQLQVHPNTVRFHLDDLSRRGQVEQLLGDTAGRGRPPVRFRATRRMDPAGPTSYQLLATMLTSLLAGGPNARDRATELGRAWGPRLIASAPSGPWHPRQPTRRAAVTQLTGMLATLGFAPEPVNGSTATSVRLRHCPFLQVVTDGQGELDESSSAVICSLHLGLMQGALAAVGGPVTVDLLEPFAQPDLCVAHLARPTQPVMAKDRLHA